MSLPESVADSWSGRGGHSCPREHRKSLLLPGYAQRAMRSPDEPGSQDLGSQREMQTEGSPGVKNLALICEAPARMIRGPILCSTPLHVRVAMSPQKR